MDRRRHLDKISEGPRTDPRNLALLIRLHVLRPCVRYNAIMMMAFIVALVLKRELARLTRTETHDSN